MSKITTETGDFNQYRPITTPFVAWHDWSHGGDIGTSIVMATAKATGDDPRDLPPLFFTIDPDALDRLFRPRSDTIPLCEGRITFEYAGQTVTLHSDGEIVVAPQDDS